MGRMTTSRLPERKGWHALLPGGQLRALPLRDHLRGYTGESLRRDTAAGLNVALLAVPQGMAYAMIAGLPHEASGVLCSAVASIAGAIFASSRFTILGPTNATALMVFSATARLVGVVPPALLLPMLGLLTGLLLIAGARLRMADMVQYISRSVVVGYVTGAALLISAGQLREVLGITEGDRGRTFFGMITGTVAQLSTVQWSAVVLSAGAILGYIILRRKWPRLPAFAIVLATAAVTSVLMSRAGWKVVTLHTFEPSDLMPSRPDATWWEGTEVLGALFGPAMALAFLAALENTVMGKALAGSTGGKVNLNQDLLACGLANAGCAFAGGMPASGSLTRSALNHSSGARTPLSSLVCGLLCLAAALLLGPVMPFIPRPALAALIICVGASHVNLRHLRICWRATRGDATTLAVTILSTLLMPLHVAGWPPASSST